MSITPEVIMEQAGMTAKQYLHQSIDILSNWPENEKFSKDQKTQILCELIRAQSLDYQTERIHSVLTMIHSAFRDWDEIQIS
jgi:hypothetical protein